MSTFIIMDRVLYFFLVSLIVFFSFKTITQETPVIYKTVYSHIYENQNGRAVLVDQYESVVWIQVTQDSVSIYSDAGSQDFLIKDYKNDFFVLKSEKNWEWYMKIKENTIILYTMEFGFVFERDETKN